MTKSERYAEYSKQFEELRKKYHWERIKPNPNNWPIIKKWNTKYIYNPSGRDLFNLLENAIDTEMRLTIGKSFDDLLNVREVKNYCNTIE